MKKTSLLFLLTLLLLVILFISCDNTECRHINMSQKRIDPTCTQSGQTAFTCTDCDFTYIDNVIEPTGHTFKHNTINPSCTKDGYTEYICECGYSYTSDIVSAKGHIYKDTVKKASCTEGGYTEHTCTLCDYTYISNQTDTKNHDISIHTVAPSCTEEGYSLYSCKSCEYSYKTNYTTPLGHDLSSAITQPTCKAQGYTTYTCKNCEYTYASNYTAVIDHELEDNLVLPTCTLEGYIEHKCKNCDYIFNDSYTSPTGHIYIKDVLSEPSCIDSGVEEYICECGESYTLTLAPLEHNFSRTVTMPTLSDAGYTEFVCTRCFDEYIGDYQFFGDILPSAFSGNAEVLAKGIDISYHNYKVDNEGNYISLNWDAIKNAGISYVIIRIGDASIGIDPTFEKSYNEAKAAGLNIGFYFYTRAMTVNEIKLEANLVHSALQGKQFEYPVYLDLEDDAQKIISPSILNEMCIEFFTTLQRAGYYTGLYVNHEWLNNVIDKESAISHFDIWYARYPEDDQPVWNVEDNGEHLGMWQYSQTGTIDGIEDTCFDLNYSYKDYPTLIKQYGFNGYESDVRFVDSCKSFVWVIYDGSIKIRSKSDYFTATEEDNYDPDIDIIGYAAKGSRFEVVQITEKYTAINYNGQTAYISANPAYVSFDGIYNK